MPMFSTLLFLAVSQAIPVLPWDDVSKSGQVLPEERPWGLAVQRDPVEAFTYLQAALRFTFMGGEVTPGSGVNYGDLFSTGIGGSIQGGHLWRLSKTILFGPYLELDLDSFGGKSSTDSFGDALKPDSMNTLRMLGGAKIREEFGSGARFFGDQYLALGVIHYPSVGGTLTSGGITSTGNLFSSKTVAAFDLGADIGWAPSSLIDLFFGFVLSINGAPGEGKDLVIVGTGSTRPGTPVNFGLNLGVTFKF
jgi:hypothetical protein